MSSQPQTQDPIESVPGYAFFTFGVDLARVSLAEQVMFAKGSDPAPNDNRVLDAYGPGGDQVRALPQGVTGSVRAQFGDSDTQQFVTDKSDYSAAFTIDVGGKAAGLGFSAQGSSSFAFHENLFTERDSAYAIYSSQFQAYQASRAVDTASSMLDPAFAGDLAKLPATFDASNPDVFFSFFRTYGSHFVKSGIMGGTYICLMTLQKSLFTNSTTESVKQDLSAGYKAMDDSASIDFATSWNTATQFDRYRSLMQVSNFALGGTWNADKSTYVLSVWSQPILQLNDAVELLPISALVSDAKHALAIDAAIAAYLTTAAAPDQALFGGWLPFPLNTVIQATSDGMVTANVMRNNDGDRGYLIGLTDASPTPSAVRGYASMHSYDEHMIELPIASFTMPVRKGDYYNVQFTQTAFAPVASAIFQAFNGAMFTDWGQGIPAPAPASGFAFASLDAEQNDIAGSIQAFITDAHEAEVQVAGCSIIAASEDDGWIARSSLMLPVSAGASVRLLDPGELPPGNWTPPIITADWLYLAAGFSFGALRPLAIGQTYTAEENGPGFLLGWISATSEIDWPDYTIGRLDLQTFADKSDSAGLYSASACVETGLMVGPTVFALPWCPQNCALLPVPAGAAYRASASMPAGVQAGAFWVPIMAGG